MITFFLFLGVQILSFSYFKGDSLPPRIATGPNNLQAITTVVAYFVNIKKYRVSFTLAFSFLEPKSEISDRSAFFTFYHHLICLGTFYFNLFKCKYKRNSINFFCPLVLLNNFQLLFSFTSACNGSGISWHR